MLLALVAALAMAIALPLAPADKAGAATRTASLPPGFQETPYA